MDGVIAILAQCLGLVVVGSAVGLASRRNFSFAWLSVAAGLWLLNDAALTRAYGLIPDIFGGDWNWTGKILALVITLAVASHKAFGWERVGLTLKQKPGSLFPTLAVGAVIVAIYLYFALLGSDEGASAETMAYQMTMPGLEEEPFYRGTLLLALNEAFRGRARALGIEWGWGAIFSSAIFGLVHAFGFENGAFSFDLMTFLLTGVPALLLVWMRERSGSLLWPIVFHNFGNSIGLFI